MENHLLESRVRLTVQARFGGGHTVLLEQSRNRGVYPISRLIQMTILALFLLQANHFSAAQKLVVVEIDNEI